MLCKCTIDGGAFYSIQIAISGAVLKVLTLVPANLAVETINLDWCKTCTPTQASMHHSDKTKQISVCVLYRPIRRLSPKKCPCISHKIQNPQISSYPKYQIILCKTNVAVKGFSLMQAGLKWAFWEEKRELLLRHFKSKKEK